MTIEEQEQEKFPATQQISKGLDFILGHFEEPLFPKTISTFKTQNRQIKLLTRKMQLICLNILSLGTVKLMPIRHIQNTKELTCKPQILYSLTWINPRLRQKEPIDLL